MSLSAMTFSALLGLLSLCGTVGAVFWIRNSVYTHWASPTTVTVSPDFVRFRAGDGPETEFAADEIEELTSFNMLMTEVASRLVLRSDRGSASIELRAGFESNDWIVATTRYLLSEHPERIDWDTLRRWSPSAQPVGPW